MVAESRSLWRRTACTQNPANARRRGSSRRQSATSLPSYLWRGANVSENSRMATRRRALPQYATAAPKT